MEKYKILIIEDNPDILSSNRGLLELAGYSVITAETAGEGKTLFTEEGPDLIILDILLPDGNGLDLCREIRQDSSVPILFLSALNNRADIINGLKEGGDDYLGKPYFTEELLLRVAALLRRNEAKAEKKQICAGPLLLDTVSRKAYANGTDLKLKPMEYEILKLLVKNRDKFQTQEKMYRKIWKTESTGDFHQVQNQIYYLRNRLSPYGIEIESRKNAGYRIGWRELQTKEERRY
jgi:DNA-binding response OmpR family regulator